MNNSLQLFPSPVFSTIIEEDTSEMDISSFNLDDRGSFNLVLNDNSEVDWRVLKKYPHVEQIILNKFKEVCDNVLHYTQDFIITTSWITEMKKGGDIEWHSHKNSFYSGIYYFEDQYPEGCGNLTIQSPIEQFRDFNLMPTQFNEYNSNDWTFVPEPRQLIFFQSYLSHVIKENKSNKVRHSVAFNIVPIGEYGNGDSTYNTDWVK